MYIHNFPDARPDVFAAGRRSEKSELDRSIDIPNDDRNSSEISGNFKLTPIMYGNIFPAGRPDAFAAGRRSEKSSSIDRSISIKT